MKQTHFFCLLAFLLLTCCTYAQQTTPIGSKNGTVVVQGKLKVDSLATMAKIKIDSAAILPADTIKSAPQNAMAVLDGRIYVKTGSWKKASGEDSSVIRVLKFIITEDGTGPANPDIDGYKPVGMMLQDNRVINANIISFMVASLDCNLWCPTCYNYVSFNKSTGLFDLTGIGGLSTDAGAVRIIYTKK